MVFAGEARNHPANHGHLPTIQNPDAESFDWFRTVRD
jgi:hypothetical protein